MRLTLIHFIIPASNTKLTMNEKKIQAVNMDHSDQLDNDVKVRLGHFDDVHFIMTSLTIHGMKMVKVAHCN